MKKKTVISITAVILLFAIGLMVSIKMRDSDASTVQESTSVETAESEEKEDETSESEGIYSVVSEDDKEQSKEKTDADTSEKTGMSETSGEDLKEQAESVGSEKEEKISDTTQQSTEVPDTEEKTETTKTTEAEDENKESGSGSGEKKNTETDSTDESSTEIDMGIYCSEYGIYGDTGEKNYKPCNEEYYSSVIGRVSNPEFYKETFADVFYDEVLGLSDRYKKEHPFSKGSILKPYYPDINATYWFTGSFKERYVVLEAYDTNHEGKYFLIEFTVTDDEKLDTVSIRELADDEVGE